MRYKKKNKKKKDRIYIGEWNKKEMFFFFLDFMSVTVFNVKKIKGKEEKINVKETRR